MVYLIFTSSWFSKLFAYVFVSHMNLSQRECGEIKSSLSLSYSTSNTVNRWAKRARRIAALRRELKEKKKPRRELRNSR